VSASKSGFERSDGSSPSCGTIIRKPCSCSSLESERGFFAYTDMVNLNGEGYFEFKEDDSGQFVFCEIEGNMDLVINTRMPELEFSWEGTDGNDHVGGRGKIEFETPFEGEGIIFIHNGDSSTFNIKRMEKAVPDNVVKLR